MTETTAAGAPASTTAGAPEATGTTTAPASGTTTPDWTTGLDADTLGYVQNKGWKGAGDVLTSYRNLEKLHGVPPDQIVKLPKDDNAEAWGAVYDRLGRPKTPAEYGIKAPEQGGDPAFVEAASARFHELGLNAKQAQGLAEWWNKTAAEQIAARDTAYQTSVAEDTAKLKTEWGAEYDTNVAKARHAAKAFGLEPADIDKMEASVGFAKLVKLMHSIGSKMGASDSFVTGDNPGGGFGMTKEAASARLAELKKDKAFGARFASGDAAARAEIRRLDLILAG